MPSCRRDQFRPRQIQRKKEVSVSIFDFTTAILILIVLVTALSLPFTLLWFGIMTITSPSWSLGALKEIVAKHWGFPSLRPLQEPAMRAVLEERDSLVVLPTGGGKSLCYQAPAVLRGDTTVVVSPLISLMKDQVDALRANGVAAVQMDSSQGSDERYDIERSVLRGGIRLLFVAPERLVLSGFQQMLQRIQVHVFAIDEAHCISHWGHDFRPEYRQLRQLKELFPAASIHAYTATATERVRRDIIEQLGLKDPEVLVGNFDRPNLTYRIVPRQDELTQVRLVLDRHKGKRESFTAFDAKTWMS
jgi:ATP-dependent DNA helicase RecQ